MYQNHELPLLSILNYNIDPKKDWEIISNSKIPRTEVAILLITLITNVYRFTTNANQI